MGKSTRHSQRSSRCRATRPSVPSRSLPRCRSRTALCLNGFAFAPTTLSATTLSADTGGRLSWVSKQITHGVFLSLRALDYPFSNKNSYFVFQHLCSRPSIELEE